MSVTYFVAVPFVKTDDGVFAGEAKECHSQFAAVNAAAAMSRDKANIGALAFARSGDPMLGNFLDATIIKTFGEVPDNLNEL